MKVEDDQMHLTAVSAQFNVNLKLFMYFLDILGWQNLNKKCIGMNKLLLI